jgi:excisionase family DNA binding protein
MSSPDTPDHEILTLEEVAHYLRLKPQTIYKWAQEQRIPAVKLGKEWRFRKSILDRWLDEQILGEGSKFGHLREPGPDEISGHG